MESLVAFYTEAEAIAYCEKQTEALCSLPSFRNENVSLFICKELDGRFHVYSGGAS